MNYMILAIIGIATLLPISIFLIIKVISLLKKERTRVPVIVFYLLSFCFVSLFIFVATLSVSYNYFYEQGINLINSEKYCDAMEPLKTAVSIRSKTGKLGILFDSKIIGFPLFFSTEKNIRMSLAISYQCKKNYQKAIKEYEKILSVNRDYFYAMAGLADMHFLAGNLKQSKNYYNKLITLQSNDKSADYYYRLGKAYMVLLKYDDAINNFQKALALGKNEKVINLYLKKCYEEIKKERA